MHTHTYTHTHTRKTNKGLCPPPHLATALTMPVFSNDKARLYLKSDSVCKAVCLYV